MSTMSESLRRKTIEECSTMATCRSKSIMAWMRSSGISWNGESGSTLRFMLPVAAVLGGLLAILLFTVLPTLIVGGVNHFVTLGRWAKVVLEAVLKLSLIHI